jgi:hypothetical protein
VPPPSPRCEPLGQGARQRVARRRSCGAPCAAIPASYLPPDRRLAAGRLPEDFRRQGCGFGADGPVPCAYSTAAAASGTDGRESTRKAFGLRRPRIDRLLVALLRPRGNHRVYLGFEPGDFVVAQLYRRGEFSDLYQSSHMIATVGDPLLGTELGESDESSRGFLRGGAILHHLGDLVIR